MLLRICNIVPLHILDSMSTAAARMFYSQFNAQSMPCRETGRQIFWGDLPPTPDPECDRSEE
jgi:hypothetical protein